MTKIQNGIGDKVGMVIQSSTMFLTGFLIGFSYSWKLTLVILSITPALIFTGAITGKVCLNLSICFLFERGIDALNGKNCNKTNDLWYKISI